MAWRIVNLYRRNRGLPDQCVYYGATQLLLDQALRVFRQRGWRWDIVEVPEEFTNMSKRQVMQQVLWYLEGCRLSMGTWPVYNNPAKAKAVARKHGIDLKRWD